MTAERADSALDRRQRFTMAVIYDVPWFKRNGNWMMKNILGNFLVTGVYTFESPEYAAVQSNVDSNLNGDWAGDRSILNPSGVKGTGSGVTALTNSRGQTVAYVADNQNAQYIVARRQVVKPSRPGVAHDQARGRQPEVTGEAPTGGRGEVPADAAASEHVLVHASRPGARGVEPVPSILPPVDLQVNRSAA